MESVDGNYGHPLEAWLLVVALLMESVDGNQTLLDDVYDEGYVALLMESVDGNLRFEQNAP